MRRTFTKQFKESAVRSLNSGASLAEVARSCGVEPNALRRWRKELSRFGDRAFQGYGRNRAARSQRSLSLVFRLTPDEFASLHAAYSTSDARSLSDYARHLVLSTDAEFPSLPAKLEQLTTAVRQLARRTS